MDRVPKEVEAAFAELGLSPETPAEQVRRAYLGVIKKRSPERDPEGFRRAREAYERLKAWSERPAPPAPVPSPVEAPVASAAPPPAEVPPGKSWLDFNARVLDRRDEEAFVLAAELLDGDVGPPHAPSLLQALLGLYAQSPGPAARRALRSLVWWARRAQTELEFRNVQEQWLLASELAMLRAELPRDVERALAGYLIDGQHDRAAQALSLFARRSFREAEEAQLALTAAPLLFDLFHRALDVHVAGQVEAASAWETLSAYRAPPPLEAERPPSGKSASPATVALYLGLFVLSIIVFLGFTAPPERRERVPFAAPPTTAVDLFCRAMPDECWYPRRVEGHLRYADCRHARRDLAAFQERATALTASLAMTELAPYTSRAVEELESRVRHCERRLRDGGP